MPMRVSFFNAERVDGSVGRIDEAVRSSGLHHVTVDGHARLVGDVQLPTHLTHEANPESKDLKSKSFLYGNLLKIQMIRFDALFSLKHRFLNRGSKDPKARGRV
jgi:hypothetical protein